MSTRKENILTALKFTSETFKLISALLAIIVTLGLAGSVYAVVREFWVGLIAGIVVVIAGVVAFLVLRRDRRRYGKPKKHFRIDALEVSLHFAERNDVEATRTERYELTALDDDLTFFTDTLVWNGSGRIEYSSANAAHSVHKRGYPVGYGYSVRFGRSLDKGEQAKVVVKCSLLDFGQAATNLLLKEVRYPTKHLTLKVTLPPRKKPASITYQTLTALTAHWSYDVEGEYQIMEDGSFQITSEVERPVRNRCYAIRWTNQVEDETSH